MGVDITMPQLSDTMHEGTILNWLKQEGDKVTRGEALAEVATDKADLEIESFHEGTLVKICAPKGTTVKVGSVIAVIGEAGEKVATSPVPAAPTPPPVVQSAPVVAPSRPVSNGQAAAAVSNLEGDRIKISPLAKNLAQTYGVDFRNLPGTGDGGRIVKKDIERALGQELPGPSEEGQGASVAPVAPVVPLARPVAAPVRDLGGLPMGRSTEPLSKMRQTIAARMVESTSTIPHFYVTSKVHVDGLKRLKNSLKPLPQYEGLTFNHLIVRAAALALRVVPRINASFQDGNLIQPQAINIGVVTAVPDGLLIPIVKNADQLGLADVVAEARALVSRARAGRPKPDDLMGGTFSVSNMGMFGVESFTAIISPGQGAILAISPIQEEAIVENGVVTVGSVMRLTLSVDHRIIDGIVAGEFLTEIKRLLEDPVLLLA